MAEIIALPLSDRWLFSVDVLRRPDGALVARLTDARTSEIRAEEQPRHAVLRLAGLLREAADGMGAEAHHIGITEET